MYKNFGLSGTDNGSSLIIDTNLYGINLAGVRAVRLKWTNLLILFRIWKVLTTRQKEYIMVNLYI